MIAARISQNRLHLQHGPIDLVIGADGSCEPAFRAATNRFATVLEELVSELPMLRSPMPVIPTGRIAKRMAAAATGFAEFVTPMAAVAGAVADEILFAMVKTNPSRAYVNNGGDIALHLATGTFDVGIADLGATNLGKITLHSTDNIQGIATSGRQGRSLSLGLADSVTVLAKSAAAADVAATLIANAVTTDASGIRYARACDLDPDSDLGTRRVVTDCGPLTAKQIAQALLKGSKRAQHMLDHGQINAAYLVLKGTSRIVGHKEHALA